MSILKVTSLSIVAFLFSITNTNAQTIEEAADLYNQANPLITSGDNLGAIAKLEAVITICDIIADSAALDLKTKVVDVLPKLFYNHAKSLFDKNLLDESINAYLKTHEIAIKYQNKEIDEMTTGALAQLYLKAGNDLYKGKSYTPAIENLKKSLEYDAANTATMLLIAENYRRLDSTQEMLGWYRMTIEKAGKNDKNAPKASERIMGHYMTTGAKLLNQKNTTEGIKYLDSAATYGQSGDLYYYYAVAYNAQQQYDKSIEASQKAIALESNNLENVAKYNFEIGTAWYGKKDNAKACEYYKLANFGKTGLRAEPMLKSLKCK